MRRRSEQVLEAIGERKRGGKRDQGWQMIELVKKRGSFRREGGEELLAEATDPMARRGDLATTEKQTKQTQQSQDKTQTKGEKTIDRVERTVSRACFGQGSLLHPVRAWIHSRQGASRNARADGGRWRQRRSTMEINTAEGQRNSNWIHFARREGMGWRLRGSARCSSSLRLLLSLCSRPAAGESRLPFPLFPAGWIDS